VKIEGGVVEDGIVVGNLYDKYSSNNIIVKYIMKGFEKSLTELVAEINPGMIHEVGCGEGYWVINWHQQGIKVRGTDVSEKVIDIARSNASQTGITESLFHCKNIYDLTQSTDAAELLVCCEVLEHLDNPEAGLIALSKAANPYLIISVPNEPIWSIMNMMRGKYLKSLGNTPGHIQRWSKKRFISLVSQYFDVLTVRRPLPWTMLLCRKKAAWHYLAQLLLYTDSLITVQLLVYHQSDQ